MKGTKKIRKTFTLDLESWKVIEELGRPEEGKPGRGRDGKYSMVLRQIITEWREMKKVDV